MADEPPPPEEISSTQASSAQNGTNDRSWERAWTLDEMRKNSDRWTLAGDAGLLLFLQEFSQKMISRTHEIEKEVANLIHESKLTGVRVNNAFNDFMMLANTQFVENRVYVDDEEIQEKTASEETKTEDQEKTREQREAELIPKVNEAIQLGVTVIEEAFEKLDTNVDNTDSEDEDESYRVDPILEAKDPYVDRLLPYMIGSPNFMNDDDVGLKDISDEESDAGSISESESDDDDDKDEKKQDEDYSYSDSMSDTDNETEKKPKKKFIESDEEDSDSEGDLFNDKRKDSDDGEETAESAVDSQEESETKTSAPEPVDFAAELAKKLGGGALPPKSQSPTLAVENEEEEDVPKQTDKHKKKKKKDKERKRSKSKSKDRDEEDLFQPDKDNSDDDLFGGGMFAKKSGGLFDKDDESDEGDLFGDESTKKRAPSVKQTKEENHIDNDEEEEEEQPKEPERKRTASGKKIPAGGVSIFGGAGMKPSGGGGRGLFDDDEEEEDLFNSISKPKSSSITEKVTPSITVKSREPAGLFADEEEEDDLFSGKPAAPSVKGSSKTDMKKPSLFDDDDDEDDVDGFTASVKSEPKPVEEKKEPPKKKLPAGAVSMFGPGGANPLAAALKKQRPQSDDEEDDWSDGNKSRSESIKSNKSTASKSSTSSKPKSNSFSRNAKTTAGIFDDDEDDLFSASTKKPATKQLEKAKQQEEKPRSGSLFDEEEEDEDLFGSKPAAKPKEQVKKPPAGAVSMFPGGIDPFGKKKQSEPELQTEDPMIEKKEEPKVEKKKEEPVKKGAISLFGDDEAEDGLFGSGEIKPPTTKGSITKPKPMFDDDDDDLFGSQQDDLFSKPPEPAKVKQPEPKVDTTTSVTKVTKPKATKPAGGASLFGDDEEEEGDLFNKPSTPRKQTFEDEVEESKPVQKKPPVGGVSMFGPGAGALLPGLKKKEEKKTEEPAKIQEVKKANTVPAVKKTADPLFGEADEEDDLFGGGPVKKQEVKPVKPTSLISPPPLESSKFDDSDEDDLFGSGKKKEEQKVEEVEKPESPVEVKPRKPVGGVSMFGGVNPFAERIKKSSETETQSSASAGLSSPDDDLFGSPDQKPKVESQKTEPQTQTEPKSPPKGKIGKLQANLNFNPAAMLPGAAPPNREPEPLNIGFDTPAEPRTLQSANKDRAKIQTKRRPPSRVARKRASAQSPDETDGFFSPASPVSTTSPTLSDDDGDSTRIPPPISDSPPRVPSPELPAINTRKTDMFGNDDLFGGSPPKSTTKSVIDSKPAISEENDIFSSNSFGASKNKKTDNIDDLFAPPTQNSAIKSESKTEQKDPLFSDTSIVTNDIKAKNKTLVNDDDDDDLFSSPSLSKPKKKDDVKKDVASEKKTEGRAKPAITPDDDLFSSPSLSSTKDKVAKEIKAATDNHADDDIFGDSSLNKKKVEQKKVEPADDDDLFAKSTKDKKTKTKKAVTKDEDLFEDDTDIFNDIPKAKPKEKKVKKKAAAPKKQIFKDDIDDIFADTSASSKPKEKKKTKKTTDTAKTEDKSKTLDDIFDDPLK